MQLTELIPILAEEALSSRDGLLAHAALLSTLEEGEADELLEEAASQYADFCTRTAAAAQSLGLAGLATVASSIGEGLGMASGLPLELRAPAGPLLTRWPDFFVAYLDAWSRKAPADAPINELLADMAAAEFLTPLDEAQFIALQNLLLTPPSLAEQQAALTPAFQPPDEAATSLALPEDADRDVVEGFLDEGPELVEKLSAIVSKLGTDSTTPAQLELAHRCAHTLKGTAAIAGVRGVATLAHALEDVLEAFRRPDFSAPAALHQIIHAGCDQLELALDHLTRKTPAPEEFAAVAGQLHAWAAHLQGVEVPEEFLSQALRQAPETAPADFFAATPANQSAPVEPATAQEPAEEEAQVRIPAKALDKIFRAINELSVGLLRLRMRSDEVLGKADAMSALEQTATQRLLDIERRVNIDGLGRQDRSGPSGEPVQGLTSNASNTSNNVGDFDAIELDRYNELTGATQALSEAIGDLRAARSELTPALREVAVLAQRQLEFAREAQFQVAQSRLRPLSDLRSRMRRIVRQTCTAVGREAALEIVGDDLRVDAAVIGPLSEALLHLLRNSVDHGIESPDERAAAGKSSEGMIRVNFSAMGGGVVTTITDDGKGLDYEAILDKAVWNGLVPGDSKLSQEQIGRLIFLPGFSTRSAVTETSGRGVGLDAVNEAVASLQGNITVTSEPGNGSAFRLFVLASVGTVHALHVMSEGEHFLVPSTQLVRAEPAVLPGQALPHEAETLASTSLSDLLHGQIHDSPSPASRLRPGLVINVDGVLRRIEVDRIVEAREFLISPPPDLVKRLAGVNGVATLADGSLGIALDLTALARKPLPVRRHNLQQLQASMQKQLHVLVADDSTSVRNTLGALLRDANYRVTTARDGLEAMKAMLDTRFSAVLTDLEMPQLNGFELTDFIRNRSDQPGLPVIMLTSRGQDKHRIRASQAGVNAFLVKPYSEQHLLDTLRSALAGLNLPAAIEAASSTVLEETT
jgi:chemotaxis protein histidine kinase CheA/AmiR/NasT family two-component response regulator